MQLGQVMIKSDMQLKREVEEELRWDPKLNAAHIGVAVDRGAVSLLGVVDTYAEKWAAEDATKRVGGVCAIAQDLTVMVLAEHARSDSEIAAAIQHALTWDVIVPKTVTAKVEQGVVTLAGQVTRQHQRQAAEHAIRYLKGVVGVVNSIVLAKPEASAEQVKMKVEAALQRQAAADAKSIRVDAVGGKVTLTGHASSWQAIEDAAHAAWAAPGVTDVLDQVRISMTI